jgi:xylose isomerase
LADRSAFEEFDSASYFGGNGCGFVALQQLAIEHVMGAR